VTPDADLAIRESTCVIDGHRVIVAAAIVTDAHTGDPLRFARRPF
jgi:hypothetical protein